jgi:hypothetical protein
VLDTFTGDAGYFRDLVAHPQICSNPENRQTLGKSAITSGSAGLSRTYPGCRQQAWHCMHSNVLRSMAGLFFEANGRVFGQGQSGTHLQGLENPGYNRAGNVGDGF